MILARLLTGIMAGTLAVAMPAVESDSRTSTVSIPNSHPNIYYHGRWDKAPATWWASSGFKLNIENLKSLSLTLGQNTSSPAAVGISVGYKPFFTVNVTEGENVIPLEDVNPHHSTVVRFNVEGWQNNRMELRSIQLNKEAHLIPYKKEKLTFQFIGDSLSAGQFLPLGVNQAWPFLVAEHFRAEHRINAQPGATLTDRESYGNMHGVEFQYFRTEDTQYFYNAAHNYTTPWDFKKDVPAPTHFVIHIGANDASWSIPEANFTQTYLSFVAKIRETYPHPPIFVFTPWGWPHADAPNDYYYPNAYKDVVDARHKLSDRNVFLVNTTGWVEFADVFPENIHPNVAGHAKIAGLFQEWLAKWGIHK